MNTASHSPADPRPANGDQLTPYRVLELFVKIQEDGKIKNGLALIDNAPPQK